MNIPFNENLVHENVPRWQCQQKKNNTATEGGLL